MCLSYIPDVSIRVCTCECVCALERSSEDHTARDNKALLLSSPFCMTLSLIFQETPTEAESQRFGKWWVASTRLSYFGWCHSHTEYFLPNCAWEPFVRGIGSKCAHIFTFAKRSFSWLQIFEGYGLKINVEVQWQGPGCHGTPPVSSPYVNTTAPALGLWCCCWGRKHHGILKCSVTPVSGSLWLPGRAADCTHTCKESCRLNPCNVTHILGAARDLASGI